MPCARVERGDACPVWQRLEELGNDPVSQALQSLGSALLEESVCPLDAGEVIVSIRYDSGQCVNVNAFHVLSLIKDVETKRSLDIVWPPSV